MTGSLTRRRFLANSALAASAFAAARLPGQSATRAAQVKTTLGTLRGEYEGDIRIFRGVPFAQPPVGPLRFRPPAGPLAWTGERDATRFAPAPIQTGEPSHPHNEDCLYLNLWAPAGKGPFPVFVWVHGGGFTGGYAASPAFDGRVYARAGILCVTVAYRLGVLGFLDLEPALGAAYAGSANNGLRDLMAALDWVQAHVADFGGDPSRVTVGGQSAGAKLTDILLGVPSARKSFHQAISESGGAERVWRTADAQSVGEGFARSWQNGPGNTGNDLLTAPASALLAPQGELMATWPHHFPLRPELDGKLLPGMPVARIAAGTADGKRLLIGTNLDESASFLGPHPRQDPTANDLGNVSLAQFRSVFGGYRTLYPRMSAERLRIRALTAEEYWIPSIRVAEAADSGQCSVWMYRFDFTESSGELAGYAHHSLETPLVWKHPPRTVENAAAERALGAQIFTAWTAFVAGQAPAAPGLPDWPRYRTGSRTTMMLNAESRVEDQPAYAEMRLWQDTL